MIRCWFAQGQELVQQSIRNWTFVKEGVPSTVAFLLELSFRRKMRISCSCFVYFYRV